MIEDNRLRRSFRMRLFFVAIATGNGNVSSSEHKVRFFVTGQGECRRFVALQRVAALAVVEVRSPGELPIVIIFVAIGAARNLILKSVSLPLGI